MGAICEGFLLKGHYRAQLVKLHHANEKFLAYSKLAIIMENNLVLGRYM